MQPFSSDTYPYERVQPGYTSFFGAQFIPLKILRYLLDLPDSKGYMPADDNSRARVRLAKYLWHDGENPLAEALPTPEEKLSLLYDGNRPSFDTEEMKTRHPKGYRLYAQEFWGQTQTDAQTTVKCYMGRVVPKDELSAYIGLTFEILCNSNQETNTKTDAYARSYNIEQCIIEALHGVNIAGVGTVELSRYAHADNGSRPIRDQGTNVGRELHLSILWMESGMPGARIEEDVPGDYYPCGCLTVVTEVPDEKITTLIYDSTNGQYYIWRDE